MTFVIRKFDYTESLGEKLKAMRHCANKTLSEMAEKTKIQKNILQAFEQGNYAKLPDPVYARNFLKLYVQALGGEAHYFLKQFESECGTCNLIAQKNLPIRRTHFSQLFVPTRFFKIIGVLSVVLLIIGYLGFQIRSIVSAPTLIVFEPSDGLLTKEAFMSVAGQAQAGTQVTVNGITVLLSQDGTFETDVALERGLNIISIQSTKRYSQPAVEYRRVVLQQEHTVSIAP